MYRYRGWGKRRIIRRKFKGRRKSSPFIFYLIFIILLSTAAFILSHLPENQNKQSEKDDEKIRRDVKISSISRSSAYKRGMDIINYVWEYVPEKNGRVTSEEVTLPQFLSKDKTKKVSGIPYCWGGFLSLDTGNGKEAENFRDALSRGYTAGNVECEGGYKDFTAGLDCSGFVSAVFYLPEKCSTQTLKYYFDEIAIKDIRPMDIFNIEKSHTFIYIKETPDKKGIITMEATTSKYASTSDKTVINYRSWESIKKGIEGKPFIPMRYRGITDDEVENSFDQYEFNDTYLQAYPLKEYDIYRGTVDYVDDVDYFKLTVNKKQSINLHILGVPALSNFHLIDDKGGVIETFKEIRPYQLELEKGTYYIKITSKDFKYSGKDEYIFYFGK